MLNNRISAKIIADSVNLQGDRITTFELVFPRYILAELNTHRVFSKNSASSRAIPFKKMVEEVTERPFVPIAWQKHHKGMQGSEYIQGEEDLRHPISTWLRARDYAVQQATLLHDNCGVTKQLANRLLEPFLYHKVILTGTEFENFFRLRAPHYTTPVGGKDEDGNEWRYFSKEDVLEGHSNPDNLDMLENYTDLDWLKINKGEAEIHIMDLAEKMYNAFEKSSPELLYPGEWHIPYGDDMDQEEIEKLIINQEIDCVDFHEAKLQIATARCARVSYQTLGDNPEINYKKDIALFNALKGSEHWSPYEHCAMAMTHQYVLENPIGSELSLEDIIECGDGLQQVNYISTVNKDVPEEMPTTWCRNFKGFIQLRATLD